MLNCGHERSDTKGFRTLYLFLLQSLLPLGSLPHQIMFLGKFGAGPFAVANTSMGITIYTNLDEAFTHWNSHMPGQGILDIILWAHETRVLRARASCDTVLLLRYFSLVVFIGSAAWISSPFGIISGHGHICFCILAYTSAFMSGFWTTVFLEVISQSCKNE